MSILGMSDARRHSVDIPISRTLVALMRVRSLRDPDMNLETSSCNSANLGMSKRKYFCKPDEIWHQERRNMDLGNNIHSDCGRSAPYCRSAYTASTKCSVKKKLVHQWCRTHVPRFFEDESPKHDVNFEHFEKNNMSSFKKSMPGPERLSYMVEAAQMRCAGSTWAPSCGVCTNNTSCNSSGFLEKGTDLVLPNGNGCGINCCCSGVHAYRNSGPPLDIEGQEHPWLCTPGRETVYHATAPCQGNASTLSEKYRPRSFHQLVGHNVIVQSLLDAINKGKVSSLYLFYGPRGTGKTSAARIFAASLNCLSFDEHRPCGSCYECTLIFSGRSKNVIELNAAETNKTDGVNFLLKCCVAPTSSSYKVFIIDDCHLLQRSAWATVRSNLEELSQQVFVMITSELDKLPSVASWYQKYHFSNIKNTDIVSRLETICLEEGVDFEEDALELISRKSSGSLNDAVMMLDQLCLLGKNITTSLVSELTGVVSDDELLALLCLALSSDTSGTVRKAREIMSSRIDPMQLTSQLANLIMDILSGRCQLGFSRVPADISMDKLKHALEILSETEKQLRTSKSKSTWLTAALLQLNSAESLSLKDMNDLVACQRLEYLHDDGLATTALPKDSSISYSHACNHDLPNSMLHYKQAEELDNIWRRTSEKCESESLNRFLWKEGRLSTIYEYEGVLVAEIVFSHPDHLSRAQNSLQLITCSLQDVLGCSTDVRISLVPTLESKEVNRKRPSFSLLSCSGRNQETFSSLNEDGQGRREKLVETTGNSTSTKTVQDNMPKVGPNVEIDSLKEVGQKGCCMKMKKSKDKESCFGRHFKLWRPFSANTAYDISPNIKQHSELKLSSKKKASFQAYLCGKASGFFCSK